MTGDDGAGLGCLIGMTGDERCLILSAKATVFAGHANALTEDIALMDDLNASKRPTSAFSPS